METPRAHLRARPRSSALQSLLTAGLVGLAAPLLPVAPAAAQSMFVIGGNEDARACFQAARSNGVDTRDLEACDRALVPGASKRKNRIATYVNRGILRARAGDAEGAMADYRSALSASPKQAEVFVNRGNLLYASGDTAGALDDYQQALALDIRDKAAAHFNLGLAYEKLGQRAEATAAYRTALEHRPEWPMAQRRLDLVTGAAPAAPAPNGS